MNAQISRLAVVALVLLSVLIAATTYWQAWAAGGLAAKQDNEIQRVAQFRIRRGLIYASDGKTVLAANRAVKSGDQTLYFRRYPTHGFASQTVGYSTQGRSRAGVEREENAYLTASNANLGTIFDKLTDNLKGATVTGNNLILNCATRWIALSCRAARPGEAQTCQYVVATIRAESRSSESSAIREIWPFTSWPGRRRGGALPAGRSSRPRMSRRTRRTAA